MSINEQDLIPFSAVDSLANGNALVLAPHPDDEIFGCYGAMRAHMAQGDRVTVVLVTDGAQQGESTDTRLQESIEAAKLLGIDAPVSWAIPDRAVDYGEPLIQRIVNAICDAKAAVVYAPWAGELHPDHRAVALAAREAVRRVGGSVLLAQYEVSAPMRPNRLLNLTGQVTGKSAAMQVFASQLAFNRYDEAMTALNRYRAYTLAGQGVESAEAYFIATATELDQAPSLGLSALPPLPQTGDELRRVTILIRSSNRATLGAALDSVSAQTYPNIDVVIVNTTGKAHTQALSCRFPVRLLEPGRQAPRALAANCLLEAARGDWLLFLDDDDWLLPDHIAKLVEAAQGGAAQVVFTDIGCADETGKSIPGVFDRDFDLQRLHVANYLPIHAVLFSRQFVEQGYRFDEGLDHFEDWDFWLQLARQHAFRHVPGVSAIYRIYNNGNSGIHQHKSRIEGRGSFLAKWAQRDAERVAGAVAMRLTEVEDELGDAHASLAERQVELTDTHGRLALAYADIGRLNREVAELRAAYEGQGAQLRELGVHTTNLEADNARLADQTLRLDAQVGWLHETIGQYEQSASWRLTAPLRGTGDLARRAVRGLRLLRGAAARKGGWLSLAGWMLKIVWRDGPRGLRPYFDQMTQPNAAVALPPVDDAPTDYERWIEQYHNIDANQLAAMQAEIASWANPPLVSILMPTYNTPEVWLRRAVETVREQVYTNWELCIADDASPEPHVRSVLEELAAADKRIRVEFRQQNGHISAASNSALALCTGEFTALFDHDDELPPDALFHVVRATRDNPAADLFYSDEDKIDVQGRRFDPYFKPDWNPDLFLSQNFFSHLGVYRTRLLRDIGGFREGFEGSQDYDLALRAVERVGVQGIVHIPRVLYHWRVLPGSTAGAGDAKPYAFLAAVKAVEEHLARKGVDAEVMEAMPGMRMLRVQYRLPKELPRVSIIIPTRDGGQVLKRCLDSIESKTTYPNYEILVVDNGSVHEETLAIFRQYQGEGLIRVLRDDRPFNYSALNNNAVREVGSELVCLLNDDTEVITPEWLDEMVSQISRPGIGAVGAKLLYPDGTVQHAGVIVGLGGVAGHPHARLHSQAGGYFGRASLQQNLSAVTAACMLVRRDVFLEVGGLNEERLAVAFNDVDLCLKIRDSGRSVVWTPYSVLYHHESLSRGSDLVPEQIARFTAEVNWMREYWGAKLDRDPAYNPNLSLQGGDFGLAWPPREPETRSSVLA
ncbi:MAG: glycosyltransferase [Burkholderiales bacterium]|nr:glycosyltransferase [Burkholderiales bacterium]